MAGERFMRKGTSKFKWTPTLTDAVAPFTVTRPEIAAAVDLATQLNDLGGMQFANSPIDTPDFSTTFTTKIGGEDTTEDPTLTFYDTLDIPANHPIQTALAKGNSGYLLAFPYGDVPTYELEIWKMVSTGCNRAWSAGNEAAKFVAKFAVSAPPTLNAIIPA